MGALPPTGHMKNHTCISSSRKGVPWGCPLEVLGGFIQDKQKKMKGHFGNVKRFSTSLTHCPVLPPEVLDLKCSWYKK